MSDTPAAVAAKNRPYSSGLAHLTPLALAVLIAAQLLVVLAPRRSPAETVVTMLITLGSFVVVFAWLRHGVRPCRRCMSVREGTGAAGAESGMVFIRLFHQGKLLIVTAAVVLLAGFALTLWMGFSGHEQYAMWPVKIGGVVADAVMALVAYSALCHIAFEPWCPLPHDEPKSA